MKEVVYDILRKIEEHNFKAYLVGGYVRDYLRKQENSDIDICTNATPKDLLDIFKDYKVTLLDYGNIILNIDNLKFEITTFRKELSYKNNRKVVSIEYVNTYEEDIVRRDFTINTICMDKDGNIIDLLNGKKDLNKKIIRSVGDPYFKMKEDSLRMLRAVRFACTLNFKLDNELKNAIVKNKELLRKLSYERKKEELNKIFTSDNKKYGIRLLKELNLEDVLELHDISNVLLTKDTIGIWATIVKKNTYPFTRLEKELMRGVNELLNENIKDPMIMYKYGPYILSIVCDLKKLNKKKYLKMYDSLQIKERCEIKITSEEICELLNRKPGPFLKKIFDKLEKDLLENKVRNNNNEIKKYLFRIYNKEEMC